MAIGDLETAKAGHGSTVAASWSRPLATTEMWASTVHQVHGCMQMATVTCFQSKWEFSLEALRSAFTVIQERHATLRTRIVRRKLEPTSKALGPGEYTKYVVYDEPWAAHPVDVETATYATLEDAVEEGVLIPYNEAAGPLWRVRIVTFSGDSNKSSGNDENRPHQLNVLWLSHHAILDGRSQMRLIKDLMMVLAQGPEHSSWRPDILGGPLPILPSLDQIVPPATPEAAKAWHPEFVVPDQTHDVIKKEKLDVPLGQLKFRILTLELDAATVSSLLARCKQEGTTAHGALNAAGLLATRHLILRSEAVAAGKEPEFASDRVMKIDWSGPASCRQYTDPPMDPESVGAFVNPYVGMATVSGPETFWDLARSVKKDLQAFLNDGVWRVPLNALKEHGCMTTDMAEMIFGRASMEAKAAKPTYETNFGMSNLGSFNFNNHNDDDGKGEVSGLSLSKIAFCSNTALTDFALTFCVVTCDGRMDITMLYTEPTLSKATVSTFNADFLHHLKNGIATKAPQ